MLELHYIFMWEDKEIQLIVVLQVTMEVELIKVTMDGMAVEAEVLLILQLDLDFYQV